MRTLFILVMVTTFSLAITSCGGGKPKKSEEMKPKSAFTGAKGEVKLITLDPAISMLHLYRRTCTIRLVLKLMFTPPTGLT